MKNHINKKIFWIASYPKSGNTWMRAILLSLFFTKDGIFNFKLFNQIRYFDTPGNYEFIKSLNLDDFKNLNDLSTIAKYWIEAQKQTIITDGNFSFYKTHSANIKINEYKYTSEETTLGLIYIVRDPRDVIISFAKHHSLSIEKAKITMFAPNAYTAHEREKNPALALRTLTGSWSDHYNSWTKNNKNLLFIKYENLIKNKKSELSRIIKFVNNYIKIPISETKINNCINSTTFESMKKNEEKGLFEENSFDKNGKKIKFFNYGKEGNWKSVLSKEFVLNIEKKFKKEMSELKYI